MPAASSRRVAALTPALVARKGKPRLSKRSTQEVPGEAPLPAVLRQREMLAERLAEPTGGNTPFTLRLDPERRLKLRLAVTVRRRSSQQLVLEALDALLDSLPEVTALAAQAAETGGATGEKK